MKVNKNVPSLYNLNWQDCNTDRKGPVTNFFTQLVENVLSGILGVLVGDSSIMVML